MKFYEHFHLTPKFAESRGLQRIPKRISNSWELSLHPKPTNSETRRVGLDNLYFNKAYH